MKKRYEKSSNNTFKFVILPRSVDDNYTKETFSCVSSNVLTQVGFWGDMIKAFK